MIENRIVKEIHYCVLQQEDAFSSKAIMYLCNYGKKIVKKTQYFIYLFFITILSLV